MTILELKEYYSFIDIKYFDVNSFIDELSKSTNNINSINNKIIKELNKYINLDNYSIIISFINNKFNISDINYMFESFNILSRFLKLFKINDRYNMYNNIYNEIIIKKSLKILIDKVSTNKRISYSSIITFSSNEVINELLEIYCNENDIEIVVENSNDDNYDVDIFSQYRKDIEKFKILKPEEELELFKRLSEGDSNAKEQLIYSNLRLVISIANRYNYESISKLDLIQEGFFGLNKAIEKFDYTKGFKFSTYASWYIKSFIVKYVSNNKHNLSLPYKYDEDLKTIRNERDRYIQENKKEPSINELSDITKISQDKIRIILELSQEFIRLNEVITGEENETEKGNMIPDKSNNDMEELEIKLLFDEIWNKISPYLSELEIKVIMYRNGFVDGKLYTLNELSSLLKYSRTYIANIEKKVYRRLRIAALSENIITKEEFYKIVLKK